MTRDPLRITAVPEREQLHEEPFIRTLRRAVLEPALLAQIRRFDSRAPGGARGLLLVGHRFLILRFARSGQAAAD